MENLFQESLMLIAASKNAKVALLCSCGRPCRKGLEHRIIRAVLSCAAAAAAAGQTTDESL